MKQQKLLVAVLVALSSMSAMAATTVPTTTTPTTAACVPQTTLTQMQAELAGIQTAKATALKPLQSKLALANQTLSTAQATLTQKRAALTAAQTELATAQNRITQITSLLGTSGTAASTNYTANLTGEIAYLKTQVAALQQRITSIKASEASAVKGYELEKADLTAQLARLKATVITQPVTALPLFKTPTEVYAWLSSERAKADAAIKLNGEIARVQALIARDDAQIARVRSDYALDRIATETEMTRINRSIELLNVGVTELNKFQQVDVAKLKAELETLMGRVTTLKAQLPVLQTALTSAEGAVKAAQTTVTALNAQITQVNTDYENRYAKLKAYIASLTVCK